MARPCKSIPSPRSSQCRAPPWHAPTNHFHRLIQSRAPMAHPHKSIPTPRSIQCCTPHDTPPTNQFHRPDPASPYINPITPIQPVSNAPWHTPINQSHRPIRPVSNSHSNAQSPLISLTDHTPYITFLDIPIMNSPKTHWNLESLVCSTSLMASLIRSVGGLSKYFYRGLWLDYLNADVIGQSINRRGVA